MTDANELHRYQRENIESSPAELREGPHPAPHTPLLHALVAKANTSWSSRRDPLRKYQPVIGLEAYTPWYIRVRAVALLLIIIAACGAFMAGVTLAAVVGARVLIETIAL